jgi:hypothetical protein
VWTGAENLALTEIGSPDSPAKSESLYRLRYPDPQHHHHQQEQQQQQQRNNPSGESSMPTKM